MEARIQDTYNFSDFTVDHYRYLIQKTKENYLFSAYDNFDKESKFVLWRHDVDLSPQRALRLAQIEHEEGVISTFFWHMHSEYYNLFDKDVVDIVRKINALGHQFGIHFDTHFHTIQNQADIESSLIREQKIIALQFDINATVFSFHNTNPFVLGCQEWTYGGLINTYAAYFQKEVTYCSDSNGYWRYNRMADIVEKAEAPRLQLLTHAEWWTEEVMSPWQKIERAIDGRALFNKKSYKDLLAVSKMKNIDWSGEI